MAGAMALVDYSSEEEEAVPVLSDDEEENEHENGGEADLQNGGNEQEQDQLQLEEEVKSIETATASSLLSPDEAFAEITGPPEFLKHAITSDKLEQLRQQQQHQKKNVDAVVEAKPQLLPRSSGEAVANEPATAAAIAGDDEAKPRVIQPQNPPAKDAADLLRMCMQCGVPKTSSEGRMVCPVCRDRPRNEPEPPEKKRQPKVKDKEKSKRMKGQSSHATWKSETEMQLRQQFD